MNLLRLILMFLSRPFRAGLSVPGSEGVLKIIFPVAADVRRLIIQHGFLADQSLLTSAATILKQALSLANNRPLVFNV